MKATVLFGDGGTDNDTPSPQGKRRTLSVSIKEPLLTPKKKQSQIVERPPSPIGLRQRRRRSSVGVVVVAAKAEWRKWAPAFSLLFLVLLFTLCVIIALYLIREGSILDNWPLFLWFIGGFAWIFLAAKPLEGL